MSDPSTADAVVIAADAGGGRTLFSFAVDSDGFGHSVDITDHVAQCLTRATRTNGVAHVCVAASTASLVIMRYEPGTAADLAEVLEKVAPHQRTWRHEVETRDPNGGSHVRSELLGTSVAAPFLDRRLVLADLHRIVLFDFDLRPASRTVFVEA